MTRWLASSLLLVGLTGFTAIHPAYSQDLDADLAADLGPDLANESANSNASAEKSATPAKPPTDTNSVFENTKAPRTGLKSVVVPVGVSTPEARSIGAYFDPAKKLLTDEVGHCQFMFLASPTYSKVKAQTEFAPIVIRNFELRMKGAIVSLAHTNYPKEFTEGHKVDLGREPYKMLTLASDAQLKARPKSKLVARGKLKVQGHPALEQVISYPESKSQQGVVIPAGVVFGRCVLNGSDMYAVSIRLDKKSYELNAEQSSASVKRFMDSLKIIE